MTVSLSVNCVGMFSVHLRHTMMQCERSTRLACSRWTNCMMKLCVAAMFVRRHAVRHRPQRFGFRMTGE